MNLREMLEIIGGTLLTQSDGFERTIKGGFAADLMSDVLASIQPDAVLFTGLCNPQVVRTAQMADVIAVVLVRGKTPPKETVELANQEGIPLISTPYGMFDVCGLLYAAGLPSLERTF